MAKLNIKLTKEQQKLAALAFIVVIVGGGAWLKLFWLPKSKEISDARAKVEDLGGKIQKALGAAARRDRMQKELADLRQQAADAEKRLPRVKDVATVLDTISALAKRNRVDINSFAPGGASSKGFFDEIPYSLSITGSYHDVGRFFASLALEERIYSVRGVSYSGGGAAAAGADAASIGKLSVTFTLISYKYTG